MDRSNFVGRCRVIDILVCRDNSVIYGIESSDNGLGDLDQPSARAKLQRMEPAHVTLTGDLSGDYVVEDRRPDGRVLLRPDLSVKAMLARHGERKLTPEEFVQHFGQLPTDGEG